MNRIYKGICSFHKISYILCIFIFFIIGQTIALAESRYIYDGSIGDTPKEMLNEYDSDPVFSYVPVEKYEGCTFIFRPSKFKEGYGSWEPGFNRNPNSYGISLNYNYHVGKTASVIRVNRNSNKYRKEYLVTIKVSEGSIYTTTIDSDKTSVFSKLHYMVLLRDIEKARELYIGRQFKYKRDVYYTYNNLEEKIYERSIDKYSDVKITDIVLSNEFDFPIRVIFITKDNNVGFVDVNMSNTNAMRVNQGMFKMYFDKAFN